MPIYEHICGPCKVSIEGIFHHADSPFSPPLCPTCKRQMVKAVSKSSFALKGKGWAKDGYSKN